MEEGHEVTEISTLSTTLDVHAMRSSIRSITSCSESFTCFFTFTRKMSFKNIQNYCFVQSTLIDAVKIRGPFSGNAFSLNRTEQDMLWLKPTQSACSLRQKILGTLPPNAIFSLLAPVLVLPMLIIAVNSPNLAHQHWEGKKTAKCPNNFDWECGWKLKRIIRVKTDNLI